MAKCFLISMLISQNFWFQKYEKQVGTVKNLELKIMLVLYGMHIDILNH